MKVGGHIIIFLSNQKKKFMINLILMMTTPNMEVEFTSYSIY